MYKYEFKIEKIQIDEKRTIDVKYRNMSIYLYTSKEKQYTYGDTLTCKIEFEKPTSNTNEGGFNYKLFLYSNNIYGTGYVQTVLNAEKHNSGIIAKINEGKYHLSKIIDNSFNEQTANIVKTMLLNDDSNLDVETKNIFYDIGIAHILVPSSSHLMYILMFVAYLGCVLNIKGKGQAILTIIIISAYLVITNFAISIIRVFLMYMLGIGISVLYRQKEITHIQKMCIVVIIILIANPLTIYNVGMLLSFASVLGIQLLSNRIKHRLEYGLNRKNDNKLLKRIVEMISITFGVQIVITPILMCCFNTIYITAIFANIFVVPLSGLLVILSIIFSLTYNIMVVADVLQIMINSVVFLIVHISSFFNVLPLSKILVFPLNIFEIIVYYFIVYTIFFSKEYYIFLKQRIKRINKKISIIIIVVSICIIAVEVYVKYVSVSIEFIDVGQGDCTLIQTKGKNILIDGGGGTSEEFDVGQRIVLPYLLYKRIQVIDYIFVSHFDNDHYGGLKAIVNNLKIRNIIIAKQNQISQEFADFMLLAKKENVNVIIVENGDKIHINNQIYFDILFPDNEFDIDSINNNSIVMKFIYYNMKVLFTGDIEKEVEKYLLERNIDVSADVLKVAHHGSNSSSTDKFLECVNPRIALIGVGKKNAFGHPSQQVISNLQDNHCNIYRTDIHGQVIIKKYMYNDFKVKTMF